MTKNRGMNHPGDRTRCAGRFVKRFGEIPALDQIREPFEKFADVNSRAMEIEPPLQENGDGDDAAGQNRPHQQSALLNVINHAGYPFSLISGIGQAGASPTGRGACATWATTGAREK